MKQSNFITWVIKHRSIKEIANRTLDCAVGWCIRPISLITPRSKRKWLIGNKTGWNDNSKYFRIFLEDNNKEKLRLIWIAKDKAERDLVRAKKFEAYTRWSVKGLYHTLTAGAFFFSSNINDINYWASGHALKINLWHGVGIKKLGMKQSDLYNPNSLVTKILTPYFYDNPTYFTGPSELMAKHFSDCYRLQEGQMLHVGYPRCDFLLQDDNYVNNYFTEYESKEYQDIVNLLSNYDKVYVYMPTFRDDQHDFIKSSGINFPKLDDLFKKKNYLLIIKLHPATRIDNIDFKGFDNIVALDQHFDIYPILKKSDVLITDYSSIYYDYILMDEKDVILFPFDYDEYIKNSRDLAFDYLTYTPGVKAWSFNNLIKIIQEEIPLDFPERKSIITTFWGTNYLNSSQSIKNAAKEKLNLKS